MSKRRILVTLESRATYGYSRNVMRAMRSVPELECLTLVTGMHLMPDMGNSVDLIRTDGFPVDAEVPLAPDGGGAGAWSKAMGTAMAGFADAMERLAPDVVLLSGDRAETLTLCVTAAYMGLPVAHIQAGDKSGHIDDAARYAIAKLAHVHFASCEDSAQRLRNLGEQDFRIHNTGAPQLDDINRDFSADAVEIDGRAIDLSRPYLLLVQHPVMAEREDAGAQMKATLDACLDSGLPVIWIYPNSDLGYGEIVRVIETYKAHPAITAVANLERDTYFQLLYNAAALVGNSSSGILEAPSFRVPVVNIGNRQRGRPQASNILNCDTTQDAVRAAIGTALTDAAFRRACDGAVNPYGDGQSGPRICAILRDLTIDRRLMDKETTF
ncbi:UDP-N-acetylglucosamine 2-epimerase [Roseospira navarrensis]|uniref:UDP-N-acetylglucosamine 2-epimerase (Hydrolyzing) n=1 Tax=Roseospira navarrensis TaxID=140058 RepID=A0A7X1ZGY3_9PROT|nr:UDP-N-acetylglucosamine 2-epimerase [Roseospira navarrensis]MQX37426.1 UDP-N-acetylglucosamine 2-epimerase (hydrolyzing) [Roseospira navarrensis]